MDKVQRHYTALKKLQNDKCDTGYIKLKNNASYYGHIHSM